MRIRPFGECGALIEFKAEVSVSVHRDVSNLFKLLHQERIAGIHDIIPAYHSITISFDPFKISFLKVDHWIKAMYEKVTHAHFPIRKFRIPVCYDADFGLDQNQVARRTGYTIEEIVARHHGHSYHVFCIGFIPGFLYLGSLPSGLNGKRLKSPRKAVPAGSVGIAGQQTGIYPTASPGGWEILGRCPVPTFLPHTTELVPFEIGDTVEFFPISRLEYEDFKSRNWDKAQFQELLV